MELITKLIRNFKAVQIMYYKSLLDALKVRNKFVQSSLFILDHLSVVK